ncbi:GWxTD domain-containing protein [Patescibacteria group bacterium AH-259-L07]|nr:GWxTD domain-containing protein [Patescibacteria group bacterium AH-259-L07]
MKKIAMTVMILISIFLIGCAGIVPRPSAFDEPLHRNISTGHPQFIAETANIQNSDSSKTAALNIYVGIPFSELKFKKIKGIKGKHQAKLDIEFRINHENGTSEYKIFKLTTPPLSYAQIADNTNKSFVYPIPYTGEPGDYILDIKVTDKIAKRSAFLQIPATITSLSPEFDISDLIIIKNLDLINTAQAISQLVPLNASALSPWNNLVCAFETYYSNQTETTLIPITVEYELRNDTKLILKKQFNTASVTTKQDIITLQINLPEEFQDGLYQLILTAHLHNPETNKRELASRTVVKTVYFASPIPRSISEMKKMVAPLKLFIPHPYTMKKNFKKARTAEEKARVLRNFWEEQGYDVMRQFYARVKYANKYYSGWRTDMGSVYTKFGPPADKEIRSDWRWVPPIKYELWHYPNYAAAHSFYFHLTNTQYNYKVFIFVDHFGINDFDFGRAGGYSKIRWHNFHELNSEIRIH